MYNKGIKLFFKIDTHGYFWKNWESFTILKFAKISINLDANLYTDQFWDQNNALFADISFFSKI